jgi:hypothetical protein
LWRRERLLGSARGFLQAQAGRDLQCAGKAVFGGLRVAMRVFLDRLYLFSGYAAGAFMVLIFLIMMYMTIGRQIGINLPAGYDFGSS